MIRPEWGGLDVGGLFAPGSGVAGCVPEAGFGQVLHFRPEFHPSRFSACGRRTPLAEPVGCAGLNDQHAIAPAVGGGSDSDVRIGLKRVRSTRIGAPQHGHATAGRARACTGAGAKVSSHCSSRIKRLLFGCRKPKLRARRNAPESANRRQSLPQAPCRRPGQSPHRDGQPTGSSLIAFVRASATVTPWAAPFRLALACDGGCRVAPFQPY